MFSPSASTQRMFTTALNESRHHDSLQNVATTELSLSCYATHPYPTQVVALSDGPPCKAYPSIPKVPPNKAQMVKVVVATFPKLWERAILDSIGMTKKCTKNRYPMEPKANAISRKDSSATHPSPNDDEGNVVVVLVEPNCSFVRIG